jgi:ParB family chromosome partitioning protein
LNTRVKISLSSKKGLIGIEFASVEDLNRILEELGEKGFGQ